MYLHVQAHTSLRYCVQTVEIVTKRRCSFKSLILYMRKMNSRKLKLLSPEPHFWLMSEPTYNIGIFFFDTQFKNLSTLPWSGRHLSDFTVTWNSLSLPRFLWFCLLCWHTSTVSFFTFLNLFLCSHFSVFLSADPSFDIYSLIGPDHPLTVPWLL